ncbi:unnamed protein product [Durusdinium trenchii]|uniref:Uncharacterized protein n=1 Tax=Durusdinium trenchii TaxID=1381693 RepID=A0ABP0R535_9DINO
MFKAQVALAVLSAGLDISLDQYGAREGPDGLEQTSAGLRRALADLSAAGGGWLTVPPGTWHVQPVNLTSHMVLWLAKGATLVADTSMARLPVIPALPSWGPPLDEATVRREGVLKAQADLRDALPRYQPLLWGNKVQNVTITGENGTLDGRPAAVESAGLSA